MIKRVLFFFLPILLNIPIILAQCPQGALISLGNDQFVCANSTITLTSTLTSAPSGSATYSWTGPSGTTIPGQTGTTLTVPANQSGTYSVSANFGNNCILTDQVVVSFLSVPTLTPSQCIASGASANLSINLNPALPSTITPTYLWNGPNGFTSSSPNPTVSPFNSNNVGTYNVTVSFNPSSGPSCVYPLSSILNLTPTTPTFSIPANGCQSTNYSPTGFSAQPNTTYSWSVSPSSSSTGLNGPTPVFNFTNSGTYSISVTATQNGCSATSSSQGISILSLSLNSPDIAPTNSPNSFLSPPVLFGGAQTYKICGSNSISSVQISNYPPSSNNSATQYTLSWGALPGVNFAANSTATQSIFIGNNPFTISASYGGCVTSINYNIYVGSNPFVSVGVGNSINLCPGQSVVANITPVDQFGNQNSPGTTYDLYFSNNPTAIVQSFIDLSATTAASPYVFNQSSCGTPTPNNCYPSQSNVFYAFVVATNACNNSCANSPAITINEKPDANFTVSSTTVCPNASVTLTNTGTLGNTVTGSATSGFSCSTTTKIKYIITPNSGFSVTSGSLGGLSPNFNNWDGTNTVVLSFNTPGTYSIKQYAQSNNCGPDSIIKTVCVINPPTSLITTNSTSICSPANITLSSNSVLPLCGTTPIPVSYSWSVTNPSNCSSCSNTIGSPSAANSSFNFTNNSNSIQTFAVSLTVTPLDPITNQPLSSPSCANTSTINIQVYPSVQISPLTTCNGNLNWNLNNQVNVPSSFTWQANPNNNVSGETTALQTSSTINDNLVNTSTTSQTVTYTVNATSNVGACTATSTFTVNLVTPLVVQPLSNQTICVGGGLGSPLNLSYTGGTGTPSYNWVLNSSTTSLSTSNPYNPAPFTNPGTYVYTGTVSLGPTGCVQTVSQQATITVVTDPIITAQPANASYCLNASPVTPLSVTASGGSGTFSYQWYSNSANNTIGGQLISNANSSSFTPPNSSTGTTFYYCIINQTGLNCSVTSAVAQVTVTPGPTFTSQPQSQTICVGGTLTALSVVYSGGNGTASYQWYSNTTNANTGGTQLSGETNATLSLPSTLNNTAANSYYYCVISFGSGSGCSVITSNVATITVLADPTFSVQPNPTQTICAGGTLASPLSATVTGGSGTITYQWYTVNGSTYTPIANSNSSSYNPTAFANAGTFNYAVSVTQSVSGCASSNSNNAEVIVVADPAVSITTGASYCQNASPVTPLSVTATGGNGLAYTYQWFANSTNSNSGGNPQPNSNSASFTPPVSSTGTVYYYCLVTNNPTSSGCSTSSGTATITVTAGPTFTSQPQSQTICVDGTITALSVAYSGGNGTASYQWYSNTTNANTGGTQLSGETNATLSLPSTLNNTAANSYYYCVISFGSGSGCSVITSNVATITVLADPTFSVQPNPTQTICVGGTLASPLSATVTGGSGTITYQWYNINGSTYSPIANSNSSSYNPTAFANAGTFNYAVSVTQSVSGCASSNSNNAEVIVVADPAVSITTGASYCQNASPVTPLSVTATGGTSSNYSYQWFNGTNQITGATSNTYTPSVAATGTINYTCQVTISPAAIGCSTTSNQATIVVNAAPTFSSQPQATQTICLDGTFNALTVATQNGTGTPTFQWYSNSTNSTSNGTLLSGETNNSYTPPSNVIGTVYYYCIATFASGGCSSITSTIGAANVVADPIISIEPIPNQSICVGGTIGTPLTATATGGTGNTSYQWSNSSGPITGETNQNFTPLSFSTVGTYSYFVTISLSGSGCNSVVSQNAQIEVVADPTVSTQPISAEYCQNASPVSALTVSATGGIGTFSYQWYSNTTNSSTGGTLIPSATNSSYTPPVNTIGVKYYYCVISQTGLNCSVTSAVASITVNAAPTFSTPALPTQTICLDGTFNALTVATQNGTGTPTYQWFSNTVNSTSNGTLISGATNSSFTPPSNVVGTTYYYCVATFASGGCSSITSTVATATVVADPVISAQPIASQSICVGGTIATALTAAATGGTGTTSYQWNNASGPIAGATNQSYLPPSFTTVGQYLYSVTITLSGSGCNALTTQNALIDVVADPIVSTQPVSASYCQNGSPVASLTISATGGVNTNYIYQWFNGTSLIFGATSNSYTPSVAATGTMNYTCQVSIDPSAIGCSVTSNAATIQVNPAPTFSTPALPTQTICLDGTFIALTVATQNGTGTPTYQWFSNTVNSTSNGTLVSGATNSSFTPPSNVVGTTYYYCVATFASGGCSAITSTVATAIVVADPVISSQPIASQSICVGGTIATALTAAATGGTGTTSYQWSNASGPIAGASNQTYLPPSFTTVGQYSYSVTITLSGSGCNALTTQNALIDVVTDPVVDTQPVNASYCQNGSPVTALSVAASGGIGTFFYQWYSNTSNSNSGGTLIPGATSSTYTPSVASIGTMYYYCSITQTGLHCNVTSNTAAIIVNQAPAFIDQPLSQTICIGGAFTPLSVSYQFGTGIPSYQWYSNSVNSYTGAIAISGATSPSFQPDASAVSNVYYFCEIAFSFGGCTSISSIISNQIVVNDPIISSQPLNSQTICVGGTIPSSLIVNVSGGTGTTTYQWFAGSNAISGATQNSFVPSIYNNPGTYDYTVNISSSGEGCAALTSQVATVEVLADPLISAPTAATYCQNASPVTALTVNVTGGAGTNAYQWYASATNTTTAGSVISNATSSSYTPAVTTVGTIYYYCIVTQSTPNCANTSLNAPIQVNLPPTISVQPIATQTLCEGGSPTPLQIAYINGTNSVTYQWYSNNVNSNTGGTPLLNETNPTYTPPSILAGTTYYYCVITFQQGGCSSLTSISSQVTIVNDPAISLQPLAAQEICQGNTINSPLTFNYTGGTGNSTIAWYLDVNPPILINGITTNSYLPIPFNIADTFNYYATLTFDGVGCNVANTQLASIIVHPTPYVTNLDDTLVLCNNGVLDIPLTASVTSTFQWDTPQTSSVNGESFLTQTSYSIDDSLTNTTTAPQFLTYSVTPTSFPYGCLGPDSTVVVQVQPDVILSMNQAIEICSGSPVNGILTSNIPSTFNWFVSIDNPNVTGESILPSTNWLVNDVLVNTSTVNQVVVYSVFPVSIQGSCPGLAQPLVVTVKPPIDILNPDTLTICSGSNVGINLVANTNVQFNWYASPSLNVLNETTSVVSSSTINDQLVNPTNAVEIVTYNVIGTSTANGCSSPVLPLYVVVNPIPSLVNLNPLTICNGNYLYPYSLQTSVTGATTNWSVLNNPIGMPSSFGSNTLPGFIATNNTIVTQTGQILITPIFTNNNVTCIGTDTTLLIPVLPTPSVNNIADIEVCNLVQVPLTPVTGPVPNTYFDWINSNIATGLNATGIGDIPVFVGLNPGTAPLSGTVSVTPYYAQNNVTCQGTPIEFEITVNPSPVLINSDIEICDQEFTNILLNANISSSFIWNAQIQPNVYNETAAPIQTSALINDQLVLATTTQQTVTYNITPISTPYGCFGNDTTIEVIVHPLPVVDFTVLTPNLCDQAQINFQNNSAGSLDYTWTFGDGDSSFLFNPVHEYANFGSYLVQLEAIDQITGCFNQESQVLTINESPEANFILSDSIACGSLDVVFNALDLNPSWSYLWTFGDGTSSNQYGLAGHQYVTNGCFDVTLQISTPQGCVSDTTQLDAICIFPEPIAAFTMDDPVISSLTPEVQFFNSSLYADTYFWNFGDGTSSITENPNHLFPSDPATYVIVLTASNQIGCQDTAALTVTVWQDLAIYVPNTFTPDNDEHNQTFKPILTEGFKKDSYHLIIFNRWGEVVFESKDYNFGWDGTYQFSEHIPVKNGFLLKDIICPDGTYTWKIEIIELQSGETRRFLGHVNLIR